MDDAMLNAVPAGRWGIGVSGGADSVALLRLMLGRTDIQLHVIHLDHQTREGESAVDAAFVTQLAMELKLPCTIQKRSALEKEIAAASNNTSSRFRAARFALFARVIAAENLHGVLLAHHADDQAETVLMKVLRGASPENLTGMRFKSTVRGMQILRPLLAVRGAELRTFLEKLGQSWREDSSNRSDRYQRNRLRGWLLHQPDLIAPLLEMQAAGESLRAWLDGAAPRLGESFAMEALSGLPSPLAKHAAARWLIERGAPHGLIHTQACNRLIEMATDAASPRRQHFPGGLLVCRSRGMILVG